YRCRVWRRFRGRVVLDVDDGQPQQLDHDVVGREVPAGPGGAWTGSLSHPWVMASTPAWKRLCAPSRSMIWAIMRRTVRTDRLSFLLATSSVCPWARILIS